MLRIVALLVAGSAALFAQYKADAAGTPPSEAAPAIQQALEPHGFKISHAGDPYCEIWFRANPPQATGAAAPNITLPSIPDGALVGLIRFYGTASDRRGQSIPAGAYTLRYARMPANQAHEGAAPQRDFLVLAPASADRNPAAIPGFDALINLGKKASLTAHPFVLSIFKAESGATGFAQHGDDWVLETSFGGAPMAVILIGTSGS